MKLGSNKVGLIKPLITIDFDGVVTSPHRMKSKALKLLGYIVPPEHTDRKFISDNYDIPIDVYEEATFKVNCINLNDVPLETGALSAINEIKKLGFDIIIVTSRRDNEIKYVYDYLRLKGLDDIKVLNTNRKPKLVILKRLKPLLHLDDSLYKLMELEDLRDEIYLMLLQNSANQYSSQNAARLGYSLGDWNFVVKILKEFFNR